MAGLRRSRGETVAHPALESTALELGDEQPGRLDKVVFGFTAVVSLAFVLWGVLH